MTPMTRLQQLFLFRLERLARHLCDCVNGVSPTIVAIISEIRLARLLWQAGFPFDSCRDFALRRLSPRVANALESPTDLGWPFDLFIHNVPLGMELFSEIEGSSEPFDAFVAGLRRLGFYLPMPQYQ
jgi:hypothetical protein